MLQQYPLQKVIWYITMIQLSYKVTHMCLGLVCHTQVACKLHTSFTQVLYIVAWAATHTD